MSSINLPLKFDPYARVRINVICSAEEVDEIEPGDSEWRAIVTQSTSEDQEVTRWNEAINQLREEEAEVVLLGGRGSVVDLKTIEHYLIYLFRNGARLMSASNSFVALTDDRQGNFWPGTSNATFADIFGFGTCVHHTYLDRLGASPLAESGGLTTAARESLRTLQEDKENKHQRVMFQCVAHKLGLIAFDLEERSALHLKFVSQTSKKLNSQITSQAQRSPRSYTDTSQTGSPVERSL